VALVERIEQDTSAQSDLTVALEDVRNQNELDAESFKYHGLVAHIRERFQRASVARMGDETRWLRAYRNYRGIYGADVQFTETEKSQVFIKATKTKVLAAYAQIIDVLFAGGRFPLGIEPTTLPEGVAESVHIDPQAPKDKAPEESDPMDVYGWDGDGKDIKPGMTLKDLLGPLKDELESLDVKEGPGKTPSAITFNPAMVAAKKMQKKIWDQLDESNAPKHLRFVALEMALLGAGALKGPFTADKTYPKWEEDGSYNPIVKPMPKVEAVSIWNLYPDPDAINMDEAEWIIERHKLSRSQLRALKKRPYFRSKAIDICVQDGFSYTKQWWEDSLRDGEYLQDPERHEVLEYWGVVSRDFAEENGLDVPEELDHLDEVQINAWICGGEIIRLVLNPFTPARIPYCVAPMEHSAYGFFGVGVAENMDDVQGILNGFLRLSIDNAVLSGNCIFEIDETYLAPGQDLKIYPGKVFRRNGGQPGQTLYSQKIQNVTQETLMMFDKARQLADEVTGIPSYSHGTNLPGSGMTRTASGMSMLMGASAGNIKSIVKNLDDYLLGPIGKALFAWNMQFDFDPECNGDLEVKALGTESLLKNEIRSQRLTTFLQVGSNPALAPFIKFPYIVREIAESLELDADKAVNNPDEAQLQAMLMQSMGAQPIQQQMAGTVSPGVGGAPGGAPADPTGAGGGTMGTGGAPGPGAAGFSANNGEGVKPSQSA
jgi:hypothetical protein